MPNEKDLMNINNAVSFFIISGRIESSEQVAMSRDNVPIFNTLIKGKVPDEYSNPPQWAITSNIRFGKPGDIVNNIKSEVRCRSYLVEHTDERTGVVSKTRRYTHDLWLVQ
ncbi:MAG: hypothetical protein PHI97_21910 [Desulfobulbus sp.]|nr:hypothetical protein [Desulfobulbus sp.]